MFTQQMWTYVAVLSDGIFQMTKKLLFYLPDYSCHYIEVAVSIK